MPGTPSWFARLPNYSRRPDTKVVIVDNQVLSYRLLDGRTDADYDFLFLDPRVVMQIGRQVIDETLHSVGIDDRGIEPDRRGRPIRVGPETYRPGLPLALHQRMWEGQAQLQQQGKLILVGSFANPHQRMSYERLATLIHAACGRNMGPKDARVVADAMVRRIPLYCGDGRARHALSAGLSRDVVLNTELRGASLSGFAANMFLP